jgi:6-phosphogluconolactonase/glucosamine-6-phosphate isomerase/deaminase
MQFIQAKDWDTGTQALTERLTRELKKKQRVLWLVGGGSNISVSVKVMAALPNEQTKDLAIFMTDERYGEIDHVDSNAKQLYDAGFHTKQAIFVPMLAPGFSLNETRERYAQAIKLAMEHADVIIAQFGIGPDGHIAGILPHSEGVEAHGWVCAYEAPHYMRVTLTFDALRHITAAYVFARGDEKKPALELLRDHNLTLIEEPAQILKDLPEAYIYNDQIGVKP